MPSAQSSDRLGDQFEETFDTVVVGDVFAGGAAAIEAGNLAGGVQHAGHTAPRQRILNAYGEPIPGLYEAGEPGSIWDSLYLGGGNLPQCFITGRIAAREVATGSRSL